MDVVLLLLLLPLLLLGTCDFLSFLTSARPYIASMLLCALEHVSVYPSVSVSVCTGHIQQHKDLICTHTQIDVKILLLRSLSAHGVLYSPKFSTNGTNGTCTHTHTHSSCLASLLLHFIDIYTDTIIPKRTHTFASSYRSIYFIECMACENSLRMLRNAQILQLFGRQEHRLLW